MRYEARIIENGKARYAECGEHTHGDALLYLVQADYLNRLGVSPCTTI